MKRLIIFIFTSVAILTVNAQKRLVPIDGNTLAVYEEIFKQTSFNKARGYRYISAPSFSKPYALLITRNSPMTMKISSLLKAMDKDGEYSLESDAATIYAFASLMTVAVATAMEPYGGEIGLDGNTYFFINNVSYAEAWTPTEGTNCSRLVMLMDNVFKAVKTGDKALLKAQMPDAQALIATFKSYYPKDVFKTKASVQGLFNIHTGKDSYAISLNNYLMCTSFEVDKKDYKKGMEQLLQAKYGATLEEAAKWLFLNTSAMDLKSYSCPLSLRVDDAVPRCFENTEMYGADFTIHAEDITVNNLIGLFRKSLK